MDDKIGALTHLDWDFVRQEAIRRHWLASIGSDWREEDEIARYEARQARCRELEADLEQHKYHLARAQRIWGELLALDYDYYASGYQDWCVGVGVRPRWGGQG